MGLCLPFVAAAHALIGLVRPLQPIPAPLLSPPFASGTRQTLAHFASAAAAAAAQPSEQQKLSSQISSPSCAMASELACSYAVMILSDDGIPITSEKIAALVKAANVQVESYWPSLFAKLAEKRNIEDLIMNVGSGGGGAAPVAFSGAPAGGAAAEAAAPAAEEKKEEPKEESDDDMGFSLFD